MNPKIAWIISTLFSVAVGAYIFNVWTNQINKYDFEPTQITTDKEVHEALKEFNHEVESPNKHNVPTGLFIQSFEFKDSSSVTLTGYIWQRYTLGKHDDLKRGFVFPESVDSGINPKPRIAYRLKDDKHETVGWYFEQTLRQNFDYSKYPFDNKRIWLRIWHADFDKDVVLVPDLKSYKSTDLEDMFGLEKDLVTGTWEVKESFFDYFSASYDTNFGIENYIGQNHFPELRYNIIIQRKFLTAFVVNLLPLLVVVSLIFAIVLSVTSDKEKSHFGSSFTSVIGSLSGLFFIVLLAHIQIRSEFAGGLVYMEYFYFVAYLLILWVSISSYAFYEGKNLGLINIQVQDNLYVKVMFWPLVMIAALFCTIYHF